MAPTLNQEDIKLLKEIFATKKDLVEMEKRQDKKYAAKSDLNSFATKKDLKGMEGRLLNEVDKRISKSERRIVRRVDLVDKALDREHMKLVRDVDLIKIHVGLPVQPI